MRKKVNTKKEEGKDKLMWIGQNKRRKKIGKIVWSWVMGWVMI